MAYQHQHLTSNGGCWDQKSFPHCWAASMEKFSKWSLKMSVATVRTSASVPSQSRALSISHAEPQNKPRLRKMSLGPKSWAWALIKIIWWGDQFRLESSDSWWIECITGSIRLHLRRFDMASWLCSKSRAYPGSLLTSSLLRIYYPATSPSTVSNLIQHKLFLVILITNSPKRKRVKCG